MIIGVREVLQSMSVKTCESLNVPYSVEPAEYRRGMRRKKLFALLVTQHAKGAVDAADLAEYVAIANTTKAAAATAITNAYVETVKVLGAK